MTKTKAVAFVIASPLVLAYWTVSPVVWAVSQLVEEYPATYREILRMDPGPSVEREMAARRRSRS